MQSSASFAFTLFTLLFLVLAVSASTTVYSTGSPASSGNNTFSSATLKSTGGAVVTSTSTSVPGAAAVNGVAGMTVAIVGAVAAAFVAAF